MVAEQSRGFGGGNNGVDQEISANDFGCVAFFDIADHYASDPENSGKEVPPAEAACEGAELPNAENVGEGSDLPAAENDDVVPEPPAAKNLEEVHEAQVAENLEEAQEPQAAENGVQNAPAPAEIIHDESSRDSSDSSMALIADLPPVPKAVVMAMMKFCRKKIDKVGGDVKEVIENTAKLLGESEARDYLVAQNLAHQDEIEEHKHKRKVQEGKTAAQTRKANLLAANEANALVQASISNELAEKEKNRRETVESEKSALLVSNMNMSTIMKNSFAANEVMLCQLLCC